MVVPRSGSTKISTSSAAMMEDGQQHAPGERRHPALKAVAIPRKHNDEGDFAEFRGLQADAMKAEPAARAIATHHAQMCFQHQREQQQARK